MSYLFGMSDAVRLPLPDRSVDLVFGSPPYLDCRTYGINAQRDCQTWIDWMLAVTTEACRVSKGLVLWVVAGAVRQHCYQPGPEGLLYEWWKRGGMAWRPSYWYRSGIPGSGGQHWLRADVEYVLAFVGPDRIPRRGRPATHTQAARDWGAGGYTGLSSGGVVRFKKKPLIRSQPDDFGEPAPDDPNAFWTDNTAMGHVPSGGGMYGRMEHLPNGKVVCNRDIKVVNPALANPGNLIKTPEEECFWTDNTAMGHKPRGNHQNGSCKDKDGKMFSLKYEAPALANPGNLIQTGHGFGSLGSEHAHDNEAPFPEALAEFFIKTACPPGGICLDPFSGSGTTVVVSDRLGRHGVGLDIRRSQCEIGTRRITRPHSPCQRTGRDPNAEKYTLFD